VPPPKALNWNGPIVGFQLQKREKEVVGAIRTYGAQARMNLTHTFDTITKL
jgi:hypothetical protein